MQSHSPNYFVIQKAIRFKQQVVAFYGEAYLEMCPHAIGFRDRRETAVFYRFGGDEAPPELRMDPHEDWLCVPVEALVIHDVRQGQWHTGVYPVHYLECVVRA